MKRFAYLLLPLAATLGAQDIQTRINWDKLIPKAVEKVDINLDATMLKMASGFLSGQEASVRNLIGNVKEIHVKSLTFAKEGEYSLADVDAIRAQMKTPGWNSIVDVQEKGGDNAAVYLKTDGKLVQGIVVIAAEPKELTVVNIVGSLDPADLAALSGNFGIPRMQLGPTRSKKSPPVPPAPPATPAPAAK
jgi:Domain of unknown function (DUF4252)